VYGSGEEEEEQVRATRREVGVTRPAKGAETVCPDRPSSREIAREQKLAMAA
jgi:hypothetical protein